MKTNLIKCQGIDCVQELPSDKMKQDPAKEESRMLCPSCICFYLDVLEYDISEMRRELEQHIEWENEKIANRTNLLNQYKKLDDENRKNEAATWSHA